MAEPESPSRSFTDLGINVEVAKALRSCGITEPFPIQEAAIPDALAGRDVLGRGPTGSGKTLSFGLPMVQRLSGRSSKAGTPRGLVLVPTRELAEQVSADLALPAAALGQRVVSVIGGVSINVQKKALLTPVDIVVATPGRAKDLIGQGALNLSQVEITALDEADHMADMGFLPQVVDLLARTPANGQRLLFSATLDGDVAKLVDRFMNDPVEHATAPSEAAVTTMEHYVFRVESREEKNLIAAEIALRPGKTIMFVRTRYGVDKLVKKLTRAGVRCAGLHGDKGQTTRAKALAGFADGSIPVLVATDLVARGIDVAAVSLVVHVDPPAEHKAYVHRAGRTARAGESGTVVTLVLPPQVDDVEKMFARAGVSPTELPVTPGCPELVQITGARPELVKQVAAPQQAATKPAGKSGKKPAGKAAQKSSGGSSGSRSARGRVQPSRPHRKKRPRPKKS